MHDIRKIAKDVTFIKFTKNEKANSFSHLYKNIIDSLISKITNSNVEKTKTISEEQELGELV